MLQAANRCAASVFQKGSVFTKLDKDIAENYKSTYLIASPTETNAELYIKIFHQIYDDWQKNKMK